MELIMTAPATTACANGRSPHFPTPEAAADAVLDRRIKDARDSRPPLARHVEPCQPCGMWMIVTPLQRAHRRGSPAPRRGR
jgi:hypothetical protein